MKINHPLEPVYNAESKILILGTIPSLKSREVGFYYGHPQNRFWSVLSDILDRELPISIEEKKEMLLKHNIALWDVLVSCDIIGSSDNSIKNPIPNDISWLLKKTKIKTIFVTGRMAEKFYNKFCFKQTKIPCFYLPSTSPANCSLNYEKLKNSFQIILNFLK